MKVGDLVTHNPKKGDMRDVYEALGDHTGDFHTGLIVDIKRNEKRGCAFACVSSADIRVPIWYNVDELDEFESSGMQ